MYHVFSFDRTMVKKNLALSFPDKRSAYLEHLEKSFYKNRATVLLEILKSFSIKKEELIKRVVIENEAILEKYKHESKPVVVMTARYGNWEWAAQRMGLLKGFNHFCFYTPQTFKSIEKLLLNSRKSTGVRMISEKDALALRNYTNKPALIATLGDHSPSTINKVMWLPFLHQESAFLSGPAKLARILGAAVLFAEIKPVYPGHYKIELHPISEHPEEDGEEMVVKKYVENIENVILNKPSYWLWSHNRWKRKRQKVN